MIDSKTFTVEGHEIDVTSCRTETYGIHDWIATVDEYSFGNDVPLVGWGRSPLDAVNDVLENMDIEPLDELPDEKSFTERLCGGRS